MINDITTHILHHHLPHDQWIFSATQQESEIRDTIRQSLSPIANGRPDPWHGIYFGLSLHGLIQDVLAKLVSFHLEDVNSEVVYAPKTSNELANSSLASYLESRISQYFAARDGVSSTRPPSKVFSSEWLAHLGTRGILVEPAEELDWSGKGQHVEYAPEEEQDIPLTSEKILGHSQTAIIDSVKCRRIRLARKKITCSRQLRKEDAITEVEHLRRLQHAHVVCVVGTYTLRRHLAILLYPAADCDLDAFLNEHLDSSEPAPGCGADTIERFFGCLSNATAFIHEHNVKHMDIKPKNILVRQKRVDFYTVYIADFGIARSYQSPSDSETDTPVSFTRTYAAPEVVLQDKRGFNADIFSLGCVFMEMMATLHSLRTFGPCDERQRLLDLRKGTSGSPAFYDSISEVLQWYEDTIRPHFAQYYESGLGGSEFMDLCPRMLSEVPSTRPSSCELRASTVWMSCHKCDAGPEPFEAAS
ncbi:kinase-like domain-containing protein [Phaeosphaeria sp. MPI-PUGE-AT-0046c]|nr:kinase-like domain-containing protein [Phaeosphaeria sp. MPI-PUGE-AT-0046c]